MNDIPEYIESIINENIISQEMIDKREEEYKSNKRDLNQMNSICQAKIQSCNDHYDYFHDGKLHVGLPSYEALKWAFQQFSNAIAAKDYQRIASLDLIIEEIYRRLNETLEQLKAYKALIS